MKRHKKMNRRMTNRVKAAVSALLVSSMVLNPWYGIDLAVGSENNSTRVRVSGLTGGTVKVNLESSTLKEEALRAIRESAPTELENYLSTDSTTDAAVAKLLSDPNPYYTVALWTAEDEEVFAAEGIDVKVLVQKNASTLEEDEANVASASNLKKAGQFFGASVKNRKDKDIIFYPAGGTLDTLLSDFQTDTLGHAAAETESLDNSDYELTGDEKITILYMNTDTKSHSFKLSVDGNDYSTAVKVVGTGAAAKSMLNKLKAVMKGETETAAEETESTTAAEDNVLNPTSESETKTTEEFKNTEEATAETESTAEDSKSEDTAAESDTTVTEENVTEAASTEAAATEAQTAEVSQAETEAKVEKESLVEKAVEAVTEEVRQLSGENAVTRIGAFTLDKFLEEAESEAVKTDEKAEAAAEKSEEKAAEAKTEDKTEEAKEEKTTAAEDTTAADENTNQKVTTEAETSAESTESKAEESTTAAEGTTAASQEETTAVETSAVETTAAAESTEAETKAKTAMDESLAAEQKQLLSETSAADLAAELKTARLVQYTLGDLTSEFKSVTLTDANGEDAYVIRVSADEKGVIGEDWTLVAKEIVKEDAEAVTTDFDTMDADTRAALEKEGIYDQSSSLDIHFTDAEGNEVEPQGQVKVEIEVSTSALPEDVNPENLQVYHLEEKNDSLNVTNVANPEDIKTLDADGEVISKSQAVEKVEAETETAAAETNAEAAIMTAELSEETTVAETETSTTEFARLSGEVAKIKTSFTVDSFSTFTITWSSKGNSVTAKVHYVDINGIEIEESKLPNGYKSTSTVSASNYEEGGILKLDVTINGYEFQNAVVKNGSNDISINPYLTAGTNHSRSMKWLYTQTSNSQTSVVPSSGNIYVYYKQSGLLTLIDTAKTDGKFTVVLSDELKQKEDSGEKFTYEWYRCENESTQNTEADHKFDPTEKVSSSGETLVSADGKSLNVVLDHAAHDTSAATRNYYYVIVKGANGNIVGTSASQQVQEYYELQNGSFENPSGLYGGTNQVNQSTSGLYWKNTGNNGQDTIEIVDFRAEKNTSKYNQYGQKEATYTYQMYQYGLPEAKDGEQCAELNANAVGSLYQDVLTAPGTTLTYQFSHATRKNISMGDWGAAYNNTEKFPNGQIADTMYLLIMKADDAANLTNQEAVIDYKNAVLTARKTNKNAYPGVTILTCNKDYYNATNPWYTYRGTYTVPACQYNTRFFFVSGDTAFEKVYTSRTGTVGNLLDAISFSTDKLDVDTSKYVTITKKVYGVNKNDMAGYQVSFNVSENGSGSSGSSDLQTAPTITSFLWDDENRCYVGSTQALLTVDKTYTISEDVDNITFPGNTNGKYTLDTSSTAHDHDAKTVTVNKTPGATENQVTFKNEYKKNTTSLTVTKTWAENGSNSTAPSNVQAVIGLYQKVGDGEETVVTKTEDAQSIPVQWATKKSNAVGGSAEYTFENLPLTDGSGNNITYSVKEETIQKVTDGTASDLAKVAGTENYIYVGSSNDSTIAGYWTAGTPTQDSTTEVWSITNTWTDASPKSFTIQKKLKGNAAVAGTEFSFTLDLSEMDATKLALFKELNKEALGNQYNSLELDRTTSTNANVEFKLKPEKTMEEDSNAVVSVTYQIPAGVKVNVAETEISGYKTYIDSNATAANVVSGKIVAYSEAKALTENSTVLFTNEYNINPTGVRTSRTAGMMAIFMGLGLMGLMSAGYVVVRRKRW